ncbi:MAG: acetyl-CoA C-acetyltransferase [Dehalococcoidales bacterium]|nr:acetyl-CoA C-acetyltransferase [Dehalococcoidales bacterium]
MAQMREAVLVSYLRTANSRSRPREPERDVFNSIRVDEMGGQLVKEMVKRSGIKPESIDEVIVGSARAAGEQFTMGGRFINFLADLPLTVPAHFVDRQCASTMTTICNGAMEIMCGYSDIIVSVGIEHMTHLPIGGIGKEEAPQFGPNAGPSPKFYKDPKYKFIDIGTTTNMGLTAEKLGKFAGISRDEMDKWAFRSHQLAGKAIKDGYFKGEIMPVEGTTPDGKKIMIDVDQAVRGDTTLEQMRTLKPAFTADGVITAGNSSPLNAAASATMWMTREKAKEYGLKPMASFVATGMAGVDPTMMGMGPVPAVKRALKAANLTVSDIDFWEINEAFAVVPLYAMRELGINPDKVNVKGGGVAIGHPLGATGNRLVGTLARILNLEGGKYGCATPCVGGGQGVAIIIKNEQ